MNAWEWTWVTLGAVALCLEVVALVNRRTGDTLSELVWRALGVFPQPLCTVCGQPQKGHVIVTGPAPPQPGDTVAYRRWHNFIPATPPKARRLPPAWVRVRRVVFLAFFAWLLLHFATGWV